MFMMASAEDLIKLSLCPRRLAAFFHVSFHGRLVVGDVDWHLGFVRVGYGDSDRVLSRRQVMCLLSVVFACDLERSVRSFA